MQLSDGNSIFELFSTIYFGFSFVVGYFSKQNDSYANSLIDSMVESIYGDSKQIADGKNESVPIVLAEIRQALSDNTVNLSEDARNQLERAIDQLALLEEKRTQLKAAQDEVEVLRQKLPFFLAYSSFILGLYCVTLLLLSALNLDSLQLSIFFLDIGLVFFLIKFAKSQVIPYQVYYKILFNFIRFFLIVVGIIPVVHNVLFSIPMPDWLRNSFISSFQDLFYGKPFFELLIVVNICLPPILFIDLIYRNIEKILSPFEEIVKNSRKQMK